MIDIGGLPIPTVTMRPFDLDACAEGLSAIKACIRRSGLEPAVSSLPKPVCCSHATLAIEKDGKTALAWMPA
jgi:hypothetical protein